MGMTLTIKKMRGEKLLSLKASSREGMMRLIFTYSTSAFLNSLSIIFLPFFKLRIYSLPPFHSSTFLFTLLLSFSLSILPSILLPILPPSLFFYSRISLYKSMVKNSTYHKQIQLLLFFFYTVHGTYFQSC